MASRKYSKIFYNKKWNRDEEIKLQIVCKKCNEVNIIPDLEHDFFCECGNQLVAYAPHMKRISESGFENVADDE